MSAQPSPWSLANEDPPAGARPGAAHRAAAPMLGGAGSGSGPSAAMTAAYAAAQNRLPLQPHRQPQLPKHEPARPARLVRIPSWGPMDRLGDLSTYPAAKPVHTTRVYDANGRPVPRGGAAHSAPVDSVDGVYEALKKAVKASRAESKRPELAHTAVTRSLASTHSHTLPMHRHWYRNRCRQCPLPTDRHWPAVALGCALQVRRASRTSSCILMRMGTGASAEVSSARPAAGSACARPAV